MLRTALLVCLSLLIGVTSFARPADAQPSDSAAERTDEPEEAFRTELEDLINQERTSRMLAPLRVSPTLECIAQWHTDDMKRNNYFSHTGLSGSTPHSRWFQATGVSRCGIGENLAGGYQTPQAVFDGWMASRGHRENLLNPRHRWLGIGLTAGDTEHVISHGWIVTLCLADLNAPLNRQAQARLRQERRAGN